MYSYRSYGLTVGFPIPVAGLLAAPASGNPDVTLNWLGWRKPEQMPSVSVQGWVVVALANERSSVNNPRLWWRQSADGLVYLFRFSGIHAAEFLIDPAARTAWVAWTNPEVDHANLVKLMLGPVLGLMVRLSGGLPLHAGAVATPNGAVAFVGASGSGKSTMIACLLEQQCRLLSDDLIVLDETQAGVVLHPGHSVVRLWPASLEGMNRSETDLPYAYPQTRKRAMPVERPVATAWQEGPARLKAIILLSARRQLASPAPLVPLSAVEALPSLLEQVYPPLLPVAIEERVSIFSRLSRLVAQVPVYRLDRGEGFAALPAVCRQIMQMAEAA
jgi:hypothetical protein